MDFSRMELSDWLVSIGGLVMLIGTFFHFYGVGFLFPLMGVGLVVLVILDKLADVPAVSEWPGLTMLYIIVGAVSTFFALLSLLWLLFWLGGLISAIWYVTPVLQVAASAAVLVGGLMRRKEGGAVSPRGYQQPYQQQPPYQQPPQQPPYQQPPQPPQGGQGGPPPPPQTPWQ
jgi:hypothetical protein